MKSTVNIVLGLWLSLTLSACEKDSIRQEKKSFNKSNVEAIQGDWSQQCIASVCGTEDPLEPSFQKNPELQKSTQALVEGALKKPLQNYMGRIIHKKLIVDGFYRQMFQNKDQVSMSPEAMALVQSFRYVNRLNDYMSATVVSSEGGRVLDAEKLRAQLGPGHENEIEALLTLNPLLTLSQNLSGLMEKPLEIIIQALYSKVKLPYSVSLALEAEFIIEAQNKLYAIVPGLEVMRAESLVLKKAKDGKPLSYSEQLEFKKTMVQRFFISAVLDPKVQQAFAKLPFDVPAFLQQFERSYAQGKTGQTMAHPQDLKGLLNKAVQTCTTKLAESYLALPTQAQLEKFKSIVSQLETASQAMMEQKTKTSLPEPFQIEVLYPEARENILNSWTSTLQDQTFTSEAPLKKLKALPMSKETWSAMSVLAATTDQDEDFFADVFSFCNQVYAPTLNDSAIYTAKIINLSWPTIVHPELGIGIVAHEMGHIASGLLPEGVLKGEKDCLKGAQRTDQYVEEDFADLFSSELQKRLGYQVAGVQASNFACALQSRDKNYWSSAPLANLNASDPHSSGIYRLLAVSRMTQGLSPKCEKYLNVLGDRRFQNYCHWEP